MDAGAIHSAPRFKLEPGISSSKSANFGRVRLTFRLPAALVRRCVNAFLYNLTHPLQKAKRANSASKCGQELSTVQVGGKHRR